MSRKRKRESLDNDQEEVNSKKLEISKETCNSAPEITIDSLPVEILHMICNAQRDRDLSSLKACNQNFRNIISQDARMYLKSLGFENHFQANDFEYLVDVLKTKSTFFRIWHSRYAVFLEKNDYMTLAIRREEGYAFDLKGMGFLVDRFNIFSCVKHFCIRKISITPTVMKHLEKILNMNRILKLNMTFQTMDRSTKKIFFESLNRNSSVKCLKILQFNTKWRFFEGLTSKLRTGQIKELHLDDCFKDDMKWKTMFRHSKTWNLKTLVISFYNGDDLDLIEFCAHMPECLHTLKLNSMHFTENESTCMSEIDLCNLRILDLSFSHFWMKTKKLCELLKMLRLENLQFESVRIPSNEMLLIIGVLQNTRITSMKFSLPLNTDSSMVQRAMEGLKNSNLTELILHNSWMDDAFLENWFVALSSYGIKKLKMNCGIFSKVGIQYVTDNMHLTSYKNIEIFFTRCEDDSVKKACEKKGEELNIKVNIAF